MLTIWHTAVVYYWGLHLSLDPAWRIFRWIVHIRQVKLSTANYLDIRSLVFFFKGLRMRLMLSLLWRWPKTQCLLNRYLIGH